MKRGEVTLQRGSRRHVGVIRYPVVNMSYSYGHAKRPHMFDKSRYHHRPMLTQATGFRPRDNAQRSGLNVKTRPTTAAAGCRRIPHNFKLASYEFRCEVDLAAF